jgi:outer membrane receptor protein involved in Fe transport
LLLAEAAPHLDAQSITGSISGLVRDDSGAIAPGASVTVTSEETGASRSVLADERGGYRVLDLPPGRYRVSADLTGFAPHVRGDVVVRIGSDITIDVVLTVAGVSERVEVSGAPEMVDTRLSAVGGVVGREQIAELPLNGRNYLQLATLQPGVVVSRATAREFTGGFGSTQLTVAGSRPEQMGYLLDGTNIADIADKAPSSVAGVLLGVEAIREFSVQTHGYSAEFGRAAGGVVSSVTKSGTNVLRGSAFVFHRDSALDARGFFDTGELPDFRRDQFGGSLGGPLKRNRVFVFAAYEGLRERRAVTRVARLPDQAAHNGWLPDASGALAPVAIHLHVRPYLDLLFPVADGQSFGDGTAELRHAHRDPVDEHFAVGRVDWQAGANDTVMLRVSRDTSDAVTSQAHPLFVNVTGTGTMYATAQHQRLFGQRGLNTLRVALNDTVRDDDMVPTIEIPPALNFTDDPHFGVITIIGVSAPGSVGSVPIRYDQRLYQVSDTITLSRGSQIWKFGVDWQRYHFGGYSYSRYGGEFRFRNLGEFLTLRRSATAQADRFTGNLPGTDTRRSVRQDYVALFAQNDWRVRSNVSVNLGVRYDFVTTPTERDGRIAGLVRLEDLESGPRGVTPGAPLFDNPSTRSVAPRLGVAWNFSGDGRTVVRSGYGLFYQPLTVSYYRGTVFRIYPYFAGVDIRQPAAFGPGIRDVLANGTGVDTQRRSEFIDYDARQPVVQQWHVALERELPGGIRAEIGYLGSSGHNLPFYGDPNSAPTETLPDGRVRVIPGSTVRYPTWGRIRTRINVARSNAHALTAGVRTHPSGGVLVQAAYTYVNSRDTWSGGQMGTADFDNGAGSATNWWDPEAEFGPSSFDVRHSFVLNAAYELPWGRDLTGSAALLAKGWHVAGILQFASGLPFTPFIGFDRAGDGQSDADVIQKPDQIASVTYPRTADAWFDVSAFALPPAGTYGNARRNSLRGPGLTLADIVVYKDVPIGRVTAQVRVEVFNVFDWVNLGLPDASVLFNTDGSYRAGAGRITTTATSARQVQIGLKLSF